MSLHILHVADCPGAAVLIERLTEAVPARVATELVTVMVSDQAEAERLGMCGSPTLLVDGVDPFAESRHRPSLSCRLYVGPDGSLSGAPTVGALHAALRTG